MLFPSRLTSRDVKNISNILAALSIADLSDLKYLLTLRQRIVSLRWLRQKHVGRWNCGGNCGGYDGDLIRFPSLIIVSTMDTFVPSPELSRLMRSDCEARPLSALRKSPALVDACHDTPRHEPMIPRNRTRVLRRLIFEAEEGFSETYFGNSAHPKQNNMLAYHRGTVFSGECRLTSLASCETYVPAPQKGDKAMWLPLEMIWTDHSSGPKLCCRLPVMEVCLFVFE